MAVHGTRRGESVSWDYEGLLQLLSSLARERSGLPVLRCYWYEATVDGRRTAEQDALADVPGIKLRVAKIRPGRREGVETEIHRDLTTLARNSAISDALVVSAEEDLAQVIADVQDLGMRVTLVHIAVDGNWTISRSLRQESDDIIEISGDHLRPYVELIAGAEPAHADEDVEQTGQGSRSMSNGHSTAVAASYQPMPSSSGNHAPPAIYTAPVVAEYQRPSMQLPRAAAREPREARDARDDRSREDRTREDRTREDRTREDRTREDRPRTAREDRTREDRTREDRTGPAVNGEAPSAGRPDLIARQDIPARQDTSPRQDIASRQDIGSRQEIPSRQDIASRQEIARQEIAARPDIYTPPVASPRNRPERQDRQEPAPQAPVARGRAAEEVVGYSPQGPGTPGAQEVAPVSDAAQNPPAQLRRLPSARNAASPGQPGPMGSACQHGSQATQGVPVQGQGSPRSAPYSGPQPVASAASTGQGGYANGGNNGVSLSEAVQAAHEEGQEFGGSVARDAPALWLEAVLARKPRMPSDLEARLLQGSALPIDFLLHDEVRHALRRGFWDALERTRR